MSHTCVVSLLSSNELQISSMRGSGLITTDFRSAHVVASFLIRHFCNEDYRAHNANAGTRIYRHCCFPWSRRGRESIGEKKVNKKSSQDEFLPWRRKCVSWQTVRREICRVRRPFCNRCHGWSLSTPAQTQENRTKVEVMTIPVTVVFYADVAC